MFLSDSHLPSHLKPAHYNSMEAHEIECARGFLPTWHLVGTMGDFREDGDYRTLRLLQTELLLWRRGETVKCFLNVCSHRFCALTCQKEGTFPERIRCQYHGWEYCEGGVTRRIPDSSSFRPLKDAAPGLTLFPTETVGELIFVSLSANPPPIREFLGNAFELCSERFSPPWVKIWEWQTEAVGNWKAANEITLEGYHTLAAHEETLGKYDLPREDDMSHRLSSPEHCELEVDTTNDSHSDVARTRKLARLLGRDLGERYFHWHAFPHFGVIAADTYSIAQSIYPVSPDRHLNLYRMYAYRGARTEAAVEEAFTEYKKALSSFWAQVFAEDQEVIAAHHRGLSSAMQPAGGLISRREERVVHFQEYILRMHKAAGSEVAE